MVVTKDTIIGDVVAEDQITDDRMLLFKFFQVDIEIFRTPVEPGCLVAGEGDGFALIGSHIAPGKFCLLLILIQSENGQINVVDLLPIGESPELFPFRQRDAGAFGERAEATLA